MTIGHSPEEVEGGTSLHVVAHRKWHFLRKVLDRFTRRVYIYHMTKRTHWEPSKNGKLQIAKRTTEHRIEVWALRTGTHDVYRSRNFKLNEREARLFANALWAGRI